MLCQQVVRISSYASAGKSRHRLIVGSCFLVALLEGFDIQAIGVAGPLLVANFSFSPSHTGAIFGSAMVGLALGAALGGWLASILGRRLITVTSVVLFGTFTLAMTVVQDFAAILAVRFLVGLGLGAAMPNLVSIGVEISPESQRTRTVTTIFCGLPAGGAICALVASMIMEDFGWESLFLVGGVLPILILAPLLYFVLPAHKDGAVIVPSDMPRRPAPSLFSENRGVPTLLIWISFFTSLMILYLMLNWLPLIVNGKSLDVDTASAAAFWFNASGACGVLVFGYLVDRFGSDAPIGTAYLGVIAAMTFLALAKSAVGVLIATSITGFCLLGALYALYGVVPMFYPVENRNLGVGAAISIGRLGSIAGPLAAGELLAVGLTDTAVLLSTTPIALIAGIAAITASKAAKLHTT